MGKRIYKIEVLRAINGWWYYRMVASNDKIMNAGEMYASSSNAKRAATAFSKLLAVPNTVVVVEE